jgi:chemotaxis protein MotB
MAEQEPDCPKCKKGAPDWMVTFSDLMTLLLTFFVILLSMSEISEPKFEEASSSIREALTGNYILGKPQRDLVVVKLLDEANEKIEVKEDDASEDKLKSESQKEKDHDEDEKEQQKIKYAEIIEEIIQEQLQREVDFGIAEIENKQNRILIRFPAEATFESGSADIKPIMKPVIDTLASALSGLNVRALINGHTDDVPIRTSQFRNNWDLSAARAASVAMEFENYGGFASSEIEILGHADGDPLVPNISPQNREKNRRIELFIEPYDPEFDESIFNNVIEETLPDYFNSKTITEIDSTTNKPKSQEQIKKEVEKKKESWIDNTLDRIKNFGTKRQIEKDENQPKEEKK